MGCKRGCSEMELEAIYRTLVSGSKKKYYFGIKLTQEKGVIVVNDIKISGLEMKKRDKAEFLRAIQKMIVELVSTRRIPEAIANTKQMVVDLVCGRVPTERLTMVQVLNQNPEEMINLSCAAAVALQNQREGRGLAQKKEEVPFIFVKPPGYLAQQPSQGARYRHGPAARRRTQDPRELRVLRPTPLPQSRVQAARARGAQVRGDV